MTDFRNYLQTELVRRCKANPKYSLRAFARALDIEPSALSKILRGTRPVTPKTFELLAARLGLSPMERAAIRPPVLKTETSIPTTPEPDFRQLSLDMFQVIADWYHYAILELCSVKGFEPSPRWVAKALGISVPEVNVAIERLERLGLLRIENGRWIDESGSITTVGNEFTAVAFRKLQRQVLEMAIVALEEVPFELRDQSSMTMAANSKLLPEAKKKIKKFRRELCEFLQSKGSCDSVYQLSVSLYPLYKKDKGVQK